MKGFVDSIDRLAADNRDFRRVLYTGRNIQLVLMSLASNEALGEAMHESHDQFFRVERGAGEVWLDGIRTTLASGDAIIVPAGARYNIINNSEDAMQLYGLFAPPQHRDGVVAITKDCAETIDEPYDGQNSEY
ncbi:MAG: cupin domain-containing protein [Terricaulis sp.]